MSDQTLYLTEAGLAEIEERLNRLRTVRRPEVAERLRLALSEGGELVENAEYEDAKNEQAFLEGEIQRLENILSTATVIQDNGKKPTVVGLGNTVRVQEKGSKQQETYYVVGAAEADPRRNRISNQSPLGRALMGRKVGEKVIVKTPDGDVQMTVKAIE
jgi:transcription elongation factor GreA